MREQPSEGPLNQSLGRMIFEVFRLNGRLLVAADDLVSGLGLSSARWQVLWAIDIAGVPQPVAHLARSMGLNRQGVQRIVNELASEGLIAFSENPNHLRAKLVTMTEQGRNAYAAADRLRRPWLATLAEGLSGPDLDAALRVMAMLRQRLE